jgi:predicted DNA binding CopG/RHH family protein
MGRFGAFGAQPMATKRLESSVRGRRVEGSATPMPDSSIDFSDIPESTDKELHNAKRVGRPKSGDAKLPIAIRIRSSLLVKIQKAAKAEGTPYQTYIHEILENKMKKIP